MSVIDEKGRGASARSAKAEGETSRNRDASSGDGSVTGKTIVEAIERHLVRMVPLDEIQFSRRSADLKDQKGPFNPRQHAGFDELSMEELENSIAQDGLFEYPNVNLIDKGGKSEYKLLAGERRIRALRNLVKKGVKVYDEATDTLVYAAELYSTVPCRVIRNTSDMKALRIALRENSTHVPPSEKDVVETVEWMLTQEIEGHKMTRKEVAAELGKSESWLCQTLAFKSKLDEETQQKLWDGKINRSFAIDLMGYAESDRAAVCQAAEQVATERYEANYERAEAEQAAAHMEFEAAQVLVETAPTPKKKAQAKTKVERAGKKVKKADAKLQQVEAQGVQLQQSDLTIGALEVGITPQGNKGMATRQVQERWITKIDGYLSMERVRDPASSRVFPKRDLMLMKAVAEAMVEGGKEPLDILKAFYMTQEGWGLYGASDFTTKLDQAASTLKAVTALPAATVAVEDDEEVEVEDEDFDLELDEEIDDIDDVDDIDSIGLDDDDEEEDEDDED